MTKNMSKEKYDKLPKKVQRLVSESYPIVRETDHYIVFEVPWKWNWGAFILLMIAFNIFGVIGYLIYAGSNNNKWIEKTFRK